MTKKFFVSLMSLLLITALLVGCGSRPSTLREYMDANPGEWAEAQADAEAEAAQMSALYGVELTATFEIVGNHELRMNFQFPDPAFLITTDVGAGLAAGLEESLDMETDFYTELAGNMRSAMRIDTLYYSVRYLDANGSVLAERTFAGQ